MYPSIVSGQLTLVATSSNTATWESRPVYPISIGTNNMFAESTYKCVVVGNDNSISADATNCIIIGNNITLQIEDCLNDAIYIGGDSKVFIRMNGEFVDVAEKLADLEEKVNI